MHETEMTLAELVKTHQKAIFHWAYDMTGSVEDAEDLVQETFMKVHLALKNFRGESRLTTWLFKIARNTYLDRQKTRRFKMHILERPMPENTENQTSFAQGPIPPTPEQKILNDALQEDLDAAIKNLSPLQREVFVLRHYHGFKLREISSILNRTEPTVKTTLYRAIHSLRAALGHHLMRREEEAL